MSGRAVGDQGDAAELDLIAVSENKEFWGTKEKNLYSEAA
jgi:hypothetical protein